MLIIPVVVLLIVIFIGLVAGLRWFMGRHLSSATAHLQGLSQDYLHKHDELKKRLEEGERLYQEQLAKAQEEAAQLKTQALKDADAARQQTINQAHEEAERIMQQANQARDSMQRELVQSIDQRAVEQARALLQTVLPEPLREAAHGQWLDALLADGLINVQQLQTRESVREAKVVSAFALTEAQRKRLAERLHEALGSTVTLQESVDPALIAGLIITLGHLVLDGSLATKLRDAARHAQETH